MEIGAEISKKIRAAIKGKLQELGAYVDEELPDYIMVMVANKKSAQQMADDLSLFLGNNTIKFTVWLHGVLEKLRSVAVEPASLRPQSLSMDTDVGVERTQGPVGEEAMSLPVSSSLSDRTEARVSTSSADEQHFSSARRDSSDVGLSRLTSAVKPLSEAPSAEAVIDIKPELDDELMGRPEPYEPQPSGSTRVQQSGYEYRPTEGLGAYGRSQHLRGSRPFREEEGVRKRKAPISSSIVQVKHVAQGESESDDQEDDALYSGRISALSSSVSLPAKPERRPTLPPAKQANKNLILKAISEAQESISRTTNYATAPQRQMVPVAPRTREEASAAYRLSPGDSSFSQHHPIRQHAQSRTLSSRLQMDVQEEEMRAREFVVSELGGAKSIDTRSFIVRQPEAEEVSSVRSRLGDPMEEAPPSAPRTVQSSPKFIVTLDGVPSPMADIGESDTDTGDCAHGPHAAIPANCLERYPKGSVHQRLQMDLRYPVEEMEEDVVEEVAVPVKRQKVLERCRFWPVCKSGDECLYHHPTAQCKTFPSCKFGDKCLFVHPNCKYDSKCTKPDCPFTHVSRRGAAPTPRPAPASSSSICRFFPDCKKVDCTFYHPKACRFANQCKRPGCTFYHPTAFVPPRHALKWTKTSAS